MHNAYLRCVRTIDFSTSTPRPDAPCLTLFRSSVPQVCLTGADSVNILKAYYKVALKGFTDNVVIGVVEQCHLHPQGPVKSISAEYTRAAEV